MDSRFNQFEARIEKRFDALQQAMIVTLGSILAAFATLFVAVKL